MIVFKKHSRPWLLAAGIYGLQLISPNFAAANSLSGQNIPSTYASWLQQEGSYYEQHMFLGNDDQMALHWKIVGEQIMLAVGATTSGWLGFGLSESGGMKGADMFLYTVRDNSLEDAYSSYYSRPFEDTCQDWKLRNSTFDAAEGFILVEVSRALRTGDSQDIDFFDDSDLSMPGNRVIFAWGDEPQVSYHGENAGMKVVRFFSPLADSSIPVLPKIVNQGDSRYPEELSLDEGEFFIDVRASNYTIPTNMTTYAEICFTEPDLLDLGLNLTIKTHMVKAQYLPGGSEEFVHHIVLYGMLEGETCDTAFKHVWVWAPGSEDFTLPENVGLPFGPSGMTGFRMEIHYNNPDEIPDKINNSGGRLIFTTNLREHDAASFVLGDPSVALYGTPIGEGWSRWDFGCPSSCTENYFSQDITVFSNFLHMHETGERMVFNQYRDGEEIQNQFVDNYDFEQSGSYQVPTKPFIIKPGDSFNLICYYNEGAKNDNRAFGLASYEEMCMAFLWYYPRNDNFLGMCGANIEEIFPGCGGNFSYTELGSESDIGRTFGSSNGTCNLEVALHSEDVTSGVAHFGYSLSSLVAFSAVLFGLLNE